MKKPINHTIHTVTLCLILFGTTACQSQKTPKDNAQKVSEESLNKQREAERLKLCQEQLGVLSNINPKQYQQYKQTFDNLMSHASQYADLRVLVNNNTQETVDALYLYKVNFLCAGVNQAVLTGLTERGEQIK